MTTGTTGRRETKRSATRARLLDAALQLIGEGGFDTATIAEITQRADVGFGTFYGYFESKEAVLRAVVLEAMERLAEANDAITAELDDPAEVIARVGLTNKVRSRTHTLSGGQKRRLDVALGIIGRPELLFLDEPTTGFDPEARREFWALIRDLAGTGTTIVLTTHYLEEAETLADRVGVIAAGRLIAVDTPRRLGNRDSALATVSWRTPEGAWESTRSATPTAVVTDLAARFDGEVPGLTVTRPTLEDVYLEMIGAA